jgi:hypothetical protein
MVPHASSELMLADVVKEKDMLCLLSWLEVSLTAINCGAKVRASRFDPSVLSSIDPFSPITTHGLASQIVSDRATRGAGTDRMPRTANTGL